MHYAVSERVGAFIIRKNDRHLYELLLFRHLDFEQVPVQVPGGGIEPGESAEAALYREIYEESGLTELKLLRKLGITERCWLDTGATSRRHYFLLEAPPKTADRWVYVVHGKGSDAGLRFDYFWRRPPIDLTLPDGYRLFLNPQYVPELFSSG